MDRMKRTLFALRPALGITLILMILCGLAYPLLMTGISGVLFPKRAEGSLVYAGGKPVGAEHIGQEFTEDCFMKGRPSVIHYNTYIETEDGRAVYRDGSDFIGPASGSENFGPSDPALIKRVEEDMKTMLQKNPDIDPKDIPADLLTASGSGLDPHISPASAAIQLPAIARASGLSVEELEQIVERNTKGKLLGLFGEETVYVLGVNLDIAEAMGR